ncbi:hypothetical protein [Aeoliella sp. SH292]|jgi:uncharacterized protein YdcH (DUF465 family)
MSATPNQLDTIDGRFTQLVAELEELSDRIEAALAEHGTTKEK